MSQRKIVIEPDPILREKSTTIEKVDNELLKTISLFWLTAAEEKKRSTGWSVLIAVKLNNQLIFRFL